MPRQCYRAADPLDTGCNDTDLFNLEVTELGAGNAPQGVNLSTPQ